MRSRARSAGPSLAALVVLVPLLVLWGCAAGRPLGSPSPMLADSGAESVPDADEAALGADSALLVADALEACETARAFWQQGDLEAALDALDLAYELLLQLPDDPSVGRQKEDLRHLISRSARRGTVAHVHRAPLSVLSNSVVAMAPI